MDYEKLEGKIVKYRWGYLPQVKGLVVGVDRDIGITIVNAEDHEHYFLCLKGPSSPQWEKFRKRSRKSEEDYISEYYKWFDILVEQIKNGRCEPKILRTISAIRPGYPSAESCPFT